MRLRIASVLALAVVLCALPSARSVAGPQCAPCCPEHEVPAAGPDCAPQDAGCCDLVPAAPAQPGSHTSSPVPAPAIVSAPRAFAPVSTARLAHEIARESAASPPSRLSVVRLL